MRRKVIAAVLGLGLAALALTGCNETITERVEAKTQCESAGGKYYEYTSFIGTYWYNNCILNTRN